MHNLSPLFVEGLCACRRVFFGPTLEAESP